MRCPLIRHLMAIFAMCIFPVAALAPGAFAKTAPALKSDARGWYTNHKYSYVIAYPKGLLAPMGESDAGDGRRFVSKDGACSLTVWGSYNTLGETLKQLFSRQVGDASRKVTYKILGKHGFVLSGHTKDGNVFYLKTIARKDLLASFVLTYPPAMKHTVDPLVRNIAGSFVIDPALGFGK